LLDILICLSGLNKGRGQFDEDMNLFSECFDDFRDMVIELRGESRLIIIGVII